MYREVFHITEMRDGCVYQTKSTGKYILVGNDITKLDSKKITLASVSTKLTQSLEPITLDIVPISEFL